MAEAIEKKLVRASVQLVSPELAKTWLEKNTHNRKLNENRINEILGWMKSGNWELTTDAIGFDVNGVVNNGQHRLHALIKYGKPLEFIVAKNMSEDAFNVIDTNKLRSAGDVLGVNNFNHTTIKAGIARFIMIQKKGRSANAMITGSEIKFTNQQILDFAQANATKLNEASAIAQKTTSKFRAIPNKTIGGLYWLFSDKDQDLAVLFFENYSDGTGLNPKDPILLLRNKLIQDMAATRKASREEKLAWVVLTWNYVRTGRKVNQLKWKSEDGIPDII